MICQKCGANVSDEFLFCPKCGSKINTVETLQNEDAEAVRSVSEAVEASAPVEQAEVKPVESEKSGAEYAVPTVPTTAAAVKSSYGPKQKKAAKIFVLALICLAVLGVIIKSIGGLIGHSIFEKYEECPDLKVVATTVSGNYAYFTVKNEGQKTVKDFTLEYVGYDSMGNQVVMGYGKTYGTSNYATANILPNETYGLGKSIYVSNNSIRYIDAAVSAVTYMDGSDWSTKGIDIWTKESQDRFSVDRVNLSIENMKYDSELAESNPYLQITESKIYRQNDYSRFKSIDVGVKNIGDKKINKFDLVILKYDSKGYAAGDTSFFVKRNGRLASIDAAHLSSGEGGTFTWGSMFSEDIDSFKVIVYDIEFEDGTRWANENVLQWMIYNENKR